MNQDDFYNDLNRENKDYLFAENKEQWKQSSDQFKQNMRNSSKSIELTLDNYKDWAKPFLDKVEQKAYVFYAMPYTEFSQYIQNASLEFLPLGEFVNSKSSFKLKSDQHFREYIYKLLPVLRRNKNEPSVYKDFENIFDLSLEDDINFELICYYQIAKFKKFYT